MIRRATLGDVETVISLAAECHPQSHWRELIDFEPEVARASIATLIKSEDAAVLLSQRGALAVVKCPLWFSAEPVLAEYFFWSLDGSGTALRKEAEAWGAEQGLRIALMGSHEPGPTNRIENWYRRGGYVPHGHTFRKVI